jgi:hypothetical protein
VRRIDEKRLAERYPLFRAYHGLRGRVMEWGLKKVRGRRQRRVAEVQGTESAM